jgi:hypothetical protein
MRRLLLSVGLAIVVGGTVLGAAATLGVPNTSLSAGGALVSSCDTDGMTVKWYPKWDDEIDAFDTFAVGFFGLDDDCLGKPVQVILTTGGNRLAEALPNVEWFTTGPDNNYFYKYFSHVNAAQVDDLHVLIH